MLQPIQKPEAAVVLNHYTAHLSDWSFVLSALLKCCVFFKS